MTSTYRWLDQALGFSPLLLFLALVIVYNIATTIITQRKKPWNTKTGQRPISLGKPTFLPWLLPNTRQVITSFRDARHWITRGYYEYNKKGQSFQVLLTYGNLTILPPSLMDEVKNLPDSVIQIASLDTLEAWYTMTPNLYGNLYHVPLLRKDLTAKVNNFTPDIVEEVDVSMKRFLDTKLAERADADGWGKIPIFQTILEVIAQSSLRIMVGSLAREKGFQDAVVMYAQLVFPTAELMKLWPASVRPMIARIMCIPIKRALARCTKYLRPVIEQRIADIAQGLPESEQPNDFLQWLIREAPNQGANEATVEAISLRVAIVAFAALHTTALSVTNIIYDMAAQEYQKKPGELSPIDVMRKELVEVMPVPRLFEKKTLLKLYNLDAFMKETLRQNMIGCVSLNRTVIDPNGWITSTGLYFPCGAQFAFPGRNIAFDDDIYTDAEMHDYTRFYRGSDEEKRDLHQKTNTGHKSEKEETEGTGRMLDRYMVSTTNEYLIFSHGRHSCPGRFFAANEMRILMSYILLNYDIKGIEKRPEGTWMGTNPVPNMTAEIEMRRRTTPL